MSDWLSRLTWFERFNKNWMSRDQPINLYQA